jgi:hypothetical protein
VKSPLFFVVATSFAVWSVSTVVKFVMEQRILIELRTRFPEAYSACGEPSYLVLALWGKNWWRPVSASNFFRLRRYGSMEDQEFVGRAAAARSWHVVSAYTQWLMIALMVFAAYARR